MTLQDTYYAVGIVAAMCSITVMIRRILITALKQHKELKGRRKARTVFKLDLAFIRR